MDAKHCLEVSERLIKSSNDEVFKTLDKRLLKLPTKDIENNLDSHELQNHNETNNSASLSPEDDSRKSKRPKLCDSLSLHDPVISNDIEEEGLSQTELLRKQYKHDRQLSMLQTKMTYHEHLTELFFLQNGGNLVDYYEWKKRPNPLLAAYLRSEDCDGSVVADSNVNNALEDSICVNGEDTDVFESTPRNASTSYTRQRDEDDSIDQDFSFRSANLSTLSCDLDVQNQNDSVSPVSASWLTPDAGIDSKRFISPVNSINHPGYVASGYDSFTNSYAASYEGGGGAGNQETIAELAKQEAEVMEKISNLRKRGMWSVRRMVRATEPVQPKVHWDYVLEEMQWLSADFAQERKLKRASTRKVARFVTRHFQDRQQQELRAEREDSLKIKRIAFNIAKCVKEFWSNIEKVVQFKQRSRLGEKRKKALDMHLSFIVDQTEKYSSWLTEGLGQQSAAPSIAGTGPPSVCDSSTSLGGPSTSDAIADDRDFDPDLSSTDDEETIEKEELEQDKDADSEDELNALQMESEMPLEELLLKFSSRSEGEKSPAVVNDKSVEALDKLPRVANGMTGATALPRSARLRNRLAAATASGHQSPSRSESEAQNESKNISISKTVIIEAACSDDDLSEGRDNDTPIPESPLGTEFLISNDTDLVDISKSDDVVEEKKPGVGEADPGKQMKDIAEAAMSIQPTGYTLETAHVKTTVPFLIKHQLREYQHVGLDWLATMFEQRLNGILADEMGLGKTIQTIALLAYLACERNIWGPHLIVVPTSVMLNWEMECKKWCPALKILTYYGNIKERRAKRQGWTKTNAFHVCITSYKLVIQDHQAFRRKKWKYFILDEAQNIKNFKSQRWQTLLNFHSQRRLLLTGTPLQNNLMELWSLMHFLMPHVFQSHREFKEWFSNPLTGMVEGSREYNEQLVRRLHKVLRPFLLRRLKVDVEKQMPKKYEHVVMCRLSKRQRFLYDDFMSQAKTRESLATGHFMSVINILMQLRKVCNHPSLFDARPTVSSFHMERIAYHAPSLVVDMAERETIDVINVNNVHPNLVNLEISSWLMSSRRTAELATDSRTLITELSSFDNESSDESNPEITSPSPASLPEELRDLLKIDALEARRHAANQEQYEHLSSLNERRCDVTPVYGRDVRRLLNCISISDRSGWQCAGYVHFTNVNYYESVLWSGEDTVNDYLNVGRQIYRNTCEYYLNTTDALREAVRSCDDYLVALEDVIDRFVFVIPPATAPRITLHRSHPHPSSLMRSATRDTTLLSVIAPGAAKLHVINNNQAVQFPDLRLIQYDCGKLQTMDILLRRLKTGGHRVLIFTQMTRVLDILESFLNFHGHRYVRLDGTTKIEQRQALMERFNVDARIFVFILSTRSGGIGINLTGADTVIFYDSDWNPTMDAQAQDRCHRIGQTRDVHIYRLVSEKTVEENILKKANEKRLLGNVAIEGGNFTTAFFKQGTITDLFEEPTGLDSLVKGVKDEVTIGTSNKEMKENVSTAVVPVDGAVVRTVELAMNQELIEQALCTAEDESDIQAAEVARAEQKAELAEFDENIPWDGQEGGTGEAGYRGSYDQDDQSKAELELAQLEKELMPVERYAVSFVELQMAPLSIDELQRADEEVDIAKEEWELNHLKAMKEEEERRAELEEDEMLYTSSHRDLSQHYKMRLEEECNNSRLLLMDMDAEKDDAASLEESYVDDDEPEQQQPRRVGRPPNSVGRPPNSVGRPPNSVGRPSNSSKLHKPHKKKHVETTDQPKRKHTKKRIHEELGYDDDMSLDYSVKKKSKKKMDRDKHSQKNSTGTPEKIKKSRKRRRPTEESQVEEEDEDLVERHEEMMVEDDLVINMDNEQLEMVNEEVVDVPILPPKKIAMKNLKKPMGAVVAKNVASGEQRRFSEQIIVRPRSQAPTFRAPAATPRVRQQMISSSSSSSSPAPRPTTQTYQIRFPFETRPTPILEKLGASVLARSDHIAMTTATSRPPAPIALPSHLHVSRLNQIVSSISQSLLQNAVAAQAAAQASNAGPPPPSGVQYILTRPSSNLGGLTLNSLRVPGSSSAGGGQNLVFLPRAAVSRQMNQMMVTSQPAATGKQTVFILPSASVNNAVAAPVGGNVGGTNKQSFFVTQGTGGVRQFFLLPNNSISNSVASGTSGQQSFIFAPRMVVSSAMQQQQQQPRQVLNFMSSTAGGGVGNLVLPRVTFSLPAAQQQFARQLTVVGSLGNQIVLNQNLSANNNNQILLNQMPSSNIRQHSVIRSLAPSAGTSAATTTGDTVPILEKFAKQLIGAIPAGNVLPTTSPADTTRLSSTFLTNRTDIRLFQRRPNAPLSVSVIGGGGASAAGNQRFQVVAAPRIMTTTQPVGQGQIVRQPAFISRPPGLVVRTAADGTQTIVNSFLVGGAPPQQNQQRITLARLPLGNQSRIVLIDSPLTDPSLPRNSPVKNTNNRTK